MNHQKTAPLIHAAILILLFLGPSSGIWAQTPELGQPDQEIKSWNSQFPPARAEYYGEIGCSHCDTFKSKQLPAAELSSGITVELELYDILSTEGFKRCETRLSELGYSFRIFPVLILGDTVFQGNSEIEENLLSELSYYSLHGNFKTRAPVFSADIKTPAVNWALIPLFLAGLVDGINPCAFTTLLFFMSYLALKGGSRRRVAVAGIVFALGVFSTYFLLGFGLLNVFRMGEQLPILRLGLKMVVSLLTAIFCIFSIRDVVLLHRGKTSELTLKLPPALRVRIDASIRKGMRTKAFYFGIFASGIAVSILELACTGQVYFPAISIMVQANSTWRSIGSLVLYNLAFITPLLLVLCLVLFGFKQERIRIFFQGHLAFTKLAMAVVFFILALIIWIV